MTPAHLYTYSFRPVSGPVNVYHLLLWTSAKYKKMMSPLFSMTLQSKETVRHISR